jgi:hypothetical protein
VSTKCISVDFDGVVNSYRSGYNEGRLVDPPVDGAFDFLRLLIKSGYQVVIHSARFNEVEPILQVRAWFCKHGLDRGFVDALVMTAIKPKAEVYLDDRAVRFEGKFPKLDELAELSTPWHKRRRLAEVDVAKFLVHLEVLAERGGNDDVHNGLLQLLGSKS